MSSDPNPTPGYSSTPINASTPPPPPPKPNRNTTTPLQNHPSPRTSNGPPLPRPPNAVPPHLNPSQPHPPSISDHWLPPILLDKPTPALEVALTNPPLLTALTHTHPSLIPSPLPPHLTTTATLASHLLTLHAHLLNLRQRTQTHLLQLRALEHQWRAKQAQMDEQLEPWAAKSLYLRLVKAEREEEEVGAAVEESWDGRDVEGFLRGVREGRRRGAWRREMRGRWDEGRVGGWR